MKSLTITLTVCAVIIFTASANAQLGIATLTKEGAIQLEAKQSLPNAFSMDASAFNFTSEHDAIRYFADKQTSHVTFRPVFDQGKVMIYLQTKDNPDWNIEQWNAYLSKHNLLISDVNNQPSKD